MLKSFRVSEWLFTVLFSLTGWVTYSTRWLMPDVGMNPAAIVFAYLYLLVFFAALGCGLFRYLLVPGWQRAARHRRVAIVLLCGGSGLLVAFALAPDPLNRLPTFHRVEITATGDRATSSLGSEVWLLKWPARMTVDHPTPDGSWELRDGVYVSYQRQPASITLEGWISNTDTLIFLEHGWSGKATIRWGDSDPITVDLYAPDSGYKTLQPPSPSAANAATGWALILADAFLLGAVLMGAMLGIDAKRKPLGSSTTDSLELHPQATDRRRMTFISVLVITIVYLAVAIEQAFQLRFQLNPDAFGYLQIARDYAEGHFVVRGYWSPLIAWITAILIHLQIPPEVSIRLVIALAGASSIVLGAALARRFGLNWLSTLLVSMAIAALCLTVLAITADVLGLAFLLGYLYVASNPAWSKQPIALGLASGLLAGSAYLARSYNLTYVLAHLAILLVWIWSETRSRQTLLRMSIALVFGIALVSLPWVIALSKRYSQVTFSTSALHTRGLVAPGAGGVDSIVCLRGDTLCTLPADVLFAWEDHPVEIQPGYDWSPLENVSTFRHQLMLTRDNLLYLWSLNPLWLLAAIGALAGAVLNWDARRSRNATLFLVSSGLLYIGGYMLTLATGGIRYFLGAYILFFIALLLQSEQIARRLPQTSRQTVRILTVVFLGTSFLGVAESVAETLTDSIFTGSQPAEECTYTDARSAASTLQEPFVVVGGSWPMAMNIAYYNQMRTLGYLNPQLFTPSSLDQTLRQAGARSAAIFQPDQSDSLIRQYGFRKIGSVSYCGLDFVVLAVPPPR